VVLIPFALAVLSRLFSLGGTAARTGAPRQSVFESTGGCAHAWNLCLPGLGCVEAGRAGGESTAVLQVEHQRKFASLHWSESHILHNASETVTEISKDLAGEARAIVFGFCQIAQKLRGPQTIVRRIQGSLFRCK